MNHKEQKIKFVCPLITAGYIQDMLSQCGIGSLYNRSAYFGICPTYDEERTDPIAIKLWNDKFENLPQRQDLQNGKVRGKWF